MTVECGEEGQGNLEQSRLGKGNSAAVGLDEVCGFSGWGEAWGELLGERRVGLVSGPRFGVQDEQSGSSLQRRAAARGSQVPETCGSKSFGVSLKAEAVIVRGLLRCSTVLWDSDTPVKHRAAFLLTPIPSLPDLYTGHWLPTLYTEMGKCCEVLLVFLCMTLPVLSFRWCVHRLLS